MYIALTGATGFLGQYVVRRLANQGHRLRCWHRTTSDRGALADVAVEWRSGQLGDEAATRGLVKGVDAVVHSAVEWQGPRNRGAGDHGESDPFFGVNLTGTLQLFQAAWEAGVSRFVHVSSCAVHDVILNDRPLDETHPLWPNSHYGAHKAALEAFVHSFGSGHVWPICALRPTGIYGLANPAKNSRWFELVRQVVRGERIESARGGKEVHAADVARAVELLLHADPQAITGQSFNCYDMYVAEEHVARIARELTNSASVISDTNRGPKNQINTSKVRKLGMTFGGEGLLEQTVKQLVDAARQ